MNWGKSVLAVLTTLTLPVVSLAAGVGHDDSLHFSHPLFAESPSPDTKIRADYIFLDGTGDERGETHSARLEMEYALHPWLSIEADIPFTFLDPDGGKNARNLDAVEVAVKLASFSLAEHGVLLGGGIEFGLPTGDSAKMIGSSHIFEVVPFFDFGLKHEELEIAGFLAPAIPTNKNGEDVADVELEWSVSFLYHIGERAEALLEFDGARVFGGAESGFSTANISPGFKIAPTADQNLEIGVGVSIPVSSNKDFRVRTIFSVFYHF